MRGCLLAWHTVTSLPTSRDRVTCNAAVHTAATCRAAPCRRIARASPCAPARPGGFTRDTPMAHDADNPGGLPSPARESDSRGPSLRLLTGPYDAPYTERDREAR